MTIGGEFAASPNDCGLFLLGVNITSQNPFCPEYDAWETFNGTMKAGIQNFVMATFDALGDWFFWTWKVSSTFFRDNVYGLTGVIRSLLLKPDA